MDQKLVLFLALCKALMAMILINLIGLMIMLIFTPDITDLSFKHGYFSVNGVKSGIDMISFQGRLFFAGIFLLFTILDLRKRKRST